MIYQPGDLVYSSQSALYPVYSSTRHGSNDVKLIGDHGPWLIVASRYERLFGRDRMYHLILTSRSYLGWVLNESLSHTPRL